MARTVRRRQKHRIYWVEIGFLILGLIALRPSLVTDLVSMGRGSSESYLPRSQLMGDYGRGFPANYPNTGGYSSYYPNWNQPSYPSSYPATYPSAYPSVEPNLGTWNPAWQQTASMPYTTPYSASNVAWPNAQVHQWVHNGASTPLVASPSWNSSIPSTVPNRYPSTAPVYTGRY